MNNPYYNPDEDADLFDGSPAPKGLPPGVQISGIEIIGPDGQRARVNSLDEVEGAIAAQVAGGGPSIESVATFALENVFDYFAKSTWNDPSYPMLVAVADTLNELTNGRFELSVQKQKLDFYLRSYHYISRCIKQFREANAAAEQMLEAASKSPKFALGWRSVYLNAAKDLCDFMIADIAVRYYDICMELGEEPDTSLIETGYHAEGTKNWSSVISGKDIEAYDKEVDAAIANLVEAWKHTFI